MMIMMSISSSSSSSSYNGITAKNKIRTNLIIGVVVVVVIKTAAFTLDHSEVCFSILLGVSHPIHK